MEDSEQNQPAGNEAGDVHQPVRDQEGQVSRPSRVPAAPVRRQKMQPVLILSGVALVVLIIVASLTPLRGVFLSRFQAATPTAVVFPGDNLFYIEFPWGSVSIDGRPVTHLPLEGKDQPLRLSVGLHRIVWQDSPFTPVSCTVSVPSSPAGDICPNVEEAMVQVTPEVSARELTFTVSLALLPPAQRQALLQQIQSALDTLSSTGIVQPGELYVQSQANSAVGVGAIVKASQSLRATLRFVLDTDPNSGRACGDEDECTDSGTDCHQICSESDTSPDFWHGVIIAYASWSYQTLGGKPVVQNQPDATSATSGTEHSINVKLHWDGQHWHAMPIFLEEDYFSKQNIYETTNPICSQMMSTVAGGEQYNIAQAAPREVMNWSFFAGPKSSDGCLAVAVPQTSSGTASSQLPVAYALYRCGVFLAANAAAHRYWPSWPVADSYEQGLAQQLATRYSGDIQQVATA